LFGKIFESRAGCTAFIRQQGRIKISQRPFCEEVPGGWVVRYHALPVQPEGPEQTEPLDLSIPTALAAAILAKCSPLPRPRGGDYEELKGRPIGPPDNEDYEFEYDIDCNNYVSGREGVPVRKQHHTVSHQLHDETKKKRTVPGLSPSADELAFEKGCRDRPPGDYHFDDYLENYLNPEKFLLLRDYTLNYPLPDCPTGENTTPSQPGFSTQPTPAPCTILGVEQPGPPCFFG